MLLLLESIKLVAEIALMSLAGQGLLALLSGQTREQNFFYRILQIIGRPFVRLAGVLTPSFILPRHHPLVAFLILAFSWVAVTAAKITHCLEIGVELCR